MSHDSGFTSIADVMAAANEAAVKRARMEGERLKARSLAPARPAAAGSATPSTAKASGADDVMDDFDYAIQAVQLARKSLPNKSAGVPKAAMTILVAKRQIPGSDAAALVTRAIRYLDG
ncbi:MAG: hypothetical protein GEU92_02645 [Alphaproteobacteria bacterium]|nr:hypothetical protein [Alphaproteobacteria bacterium]